MRMRCFLARRVNSLIRGNVKSCDQLYINTMKSYISERSLKWISTLFSRKRPWLLDGCDLKHKSTPPVSIDKFYNLLGKYISRIVMYSQVVLPKID